MTSSWAARPAYNERPDRIAVTTFESGSSIAPRLPHLNLHRGAQFIGSDGNGVLVLRCRGFPGAHAGVIGSARDRFPEDQHSNHPEMPNRPRTP
jgi:hypothetical protein